MNVLVVEDQLVDAQIAAKTLQRAYPEAEIHFARDAADAEHRLQGDLFDLVIVDLGLPDEAGAATVRRIHSATREVTIVVFTGDDTDETLQQCMAAGADDYIVKGALHPAAMAVRIRIAMMRHADYLRRWFESQDVRDATWVHAVINDIAHELRTPLTALRTSAAALRKDGVDERHQRIVRNVDRLAEVVEALWGGVADHVLLEDIHLPRLIESLAESASCKVRIEPGPDLTVIGQQATLRRAISSVLRVVAMEDAHPHIHWRDSASGLAEVIIKTSARDAFLTHPVMRVIVADQLRASLATLTTTDNGITVRIPLHRNAVAKRA